jgi:hypothetical protein
MTGGVTAGMTGMGTGRNVDELDLLPWAAYVVGHHPASLMVWHRVHAGVVKDPSVRSSDRVAARIDAAIDELKEALRVLADAGRVDPGALDRFREPLERFVRIHGDIVQQGENPFHEPRYALGFEFEPGEVLTLGEIELDELSDLSAALIAAGDELCAYRDLGRRLGYLHYDLLEGDPILFDGVEGCGEALGGLKADVEDLLGGLAGSRRLAEFFGTMSALPSWPQAGAENRELFRRLRVGLALVDRHVRRVLSRQARPAPVLVLEGDAVYVHGTRFAYDRHSPAWFAILWELAERAAHPEVINGKTRKHLTREEIRLRTGLGPDTQPSTISRLRNKVLRPATLDHYHKHGFPIPPGVAKDFYVGSPADRNRKYKYGAPYELHLRPDQIAIRCPRPNFKPPTRRKPRRTPLTSLPNP